MPYKYVTDEDLSEVVPYFESEGLSGKDMIKALNTYGDELEFERHKEASNAPLYLKAASVGGTDLLSNTIRGTTLLTPEGSPLEGGLNWLSRAVSKQGAFGIKAGADPLVRREVAEAASGPLAGEGSLDTWMALAGQHTPLALSMATGTGAGGLMGKGLGLTGKALGAASIALPTAGIGLAESGGFLDSADIYKIDKDIAEHMAKFVGPIQGVIEEAQFLMVKGPFKSMGKAWAEAVKKLPKSGLIRKALTELGIMGIEGVEESTQGFVSNKAMEIAIKKMKERHGEDWEPAVPFQKEDLVRSGIVGGVLAGATRGAGKLASMPMNQLIERDYRKKFLKADNEALIKHMEEGGKIEDYFESSFDQIRTAPAGYEDAQARIRQEKTVEQLVAQTEQLDDINDAGKVAKKLGINPRKPDGTYRSLESVKMDIKSQVGELMEGPRVVKETDPNDRRTTIKHVVTDPPILDKVQRGDIKVLNRVERLIENTAHNIAKKPKGQQPIRGVDTNKDPFTNEILPSEDDIYIEMIRTIHDARRRALKAAGLGDDMAISSELNDIRQVELNKGNQNLENKLTRTQYARYQKSLRGRMMLLIKKNLGRKAEGAADPTIFKGVEVEGVQDENGVVTKTITPKNIPVLSWLFNYIRAKPWPFIQAANKTGMNFVGVDSVLVNRHHQMTQALVSMVNVHQSQWKNLPKPLKQGRGRRMMRDYTMWLRVSGKEKAELAKQYNEDAKGYTVVNNKKSMAERVIRESHMKGITHEEVTKLAMELESKYERLFDFFVDNGAIPLKHYRENYAPLARKYVERELTKEEPATWADFLSNGKNKHLLDGLSGKDIEDIKDLGDRIEAMKKNGYNVPGEGTPSFEYMRSADVAMLKEVSTYNRDTDIEGLTDTYMREFMRKFYFDDVAPSVHAFLENTLSALNKNGMPVTATKNLMINYLDQILGVPEVSMQVANETNLRSDKYALTRGISNMMNWWNKNSSKFARKAEKIPLVGKKVLSPALDVEFPDKITPRHVVDSATTFIYAYALGLPNMKSPIKNVATQNVMAGVIGMPTYIKGLYLAVSSKEHRERIKKGNFRAELAVPEFDQFAGRGRQRAVAEKVLSLYRASDSINVYSAASSAMVAWDRLLPEFEKDSRLRHLTKAQFDKIVFKDGNPKRMKVDDRKVMDPKRNISWAEEWKSGAPRAFKGISTEMFDKIRSGKTKEAERMFTQYMVNLSQWRYGTGGTPQFLRNPLMRAMFLFSTWPLNSMEYTAMLANHKNGLLKNALGVAAAQMIIASILTSVGIGGLKWIWTGAVPKEFGFVGPIADLIKEVLRMLHAGGDVAITSTSPAADSKMKADASREFDRAYDDMFGSDR